MSGDDRWGRSVGRSAAGMYMGVFGGRSWRVGRGKPGNMDEECGDAGDRLLGVPAPDSTGENCWFPWEFGGVLYADEAAKLVAIRDGHRTGVIIQRKAVSFNFFGM